MNNSLTWDTVSLSDYNVVVEEYEVPIMAPLAFTATSALQGDPYYTSTNHHSRVIKLALSITGESQHQAFANLEYVTGALNSISDKVFSIDQIPNRRYVGRTTAISNPQVKGRWGWSMEVSITCIPMAQGSDEINSVLSIATDPDTLTSSTIEGNDLRIPAEFYIRNETGAELTNATISLTNDTTSESISWTGTLADDGWLRFGKLDSDGRFFAVIQTSDGTGSDPEAETYSSAEAGYASGDWPRLRGGEANSLTAVGVSTGTLEITYRPRYIY